MRLALAIVSFVVLVGSGRRVLRSVLATWEQHQTAYFEQALAQAKTDAERARLR